MHWTPFAGLTALDPGDSIAFDGGSFLYRNPTVIDHFVRIGAVAHRHDQHSALPNPVTPMTGDVVGSGGALAADTPYALTYTVLDADGGETVAAPPLVITTGGATDMPTAAPSGVVDYTQGIMPAGYYYYALTYTDGQGGETPLGPYVVVLIQPGSASAAVSLTGLAAELAPNGLAVNWRLWRSEDASDWHLVLQGTDDAFTDLGFDPPDNPAVPPDTNTTGGVWSLLVTLPTADQDPALAQGSAVNVYLAPDVGFANPSLYQASIALPDAAGMTLVITQDATTDGNPPRVSTSIPGAHQIFPDTELQFGLKEPVPTASALAAGVRGDARLALDTDHLWAVLGATAADVGGWTDLTQAWISAAITDSHLQVDGTGASYMAYRDPPSGPLASGDVSDFTNVGGAAMTVANGVLTTSDETLTNSVQGQPMGPSTLALTLQGNIYVAGVPPAITVANWTAAGWPAGDSGSPPAVAPETQIDYTVPGGNTPGATLSVNAPSASYCTDFYWDGSAWQPQIVDNATGNGYSPTAQFFGESPAPVGGAWHWTTMFWRALPAKPDVYAAQWTGGGALGSGDRVRARLTNLAQLFTGSDGNNGFVEAIGVALFMNSGTDALVYYLGGPGGIPGGYAGWVFNPMNLLMAAGAGNSPPSTAAAGTVLNFTQGDPVWNGSGPWTNGPVTLTKNPDYTVAHDGQFGWPYLDRVDDLWVDVWTDGTNAYAEVFAADPATGVHSVYTSQIDLAAAGYSGAMSGPGGVVANYLKPGAGVAELSLLTLQRVDDYEYTEVTEVNLTGALISEPEAGVVDIVTGAVVPSSAPAGDHTLTLADLGTVLEMDGGTLTIPASSDLPCPLGAACEVLQLGSGAVAVQGDTGVTVDGLGTTPGQYIRLRVRQRAYDEWMTEQ